MEIPAYSDTNRVGGPKMNKQRQDAWTKDDDMLLAEIVLRHIRNGRTQLEAFKQAAEALSRTPAACGYRWNATIRKQHMDAIELAKNNRKQPNEKDSVGLDENEQEKIDATITALEQIKANITYPKNMTDEATLRRLYHLQSENQKLEREIKRYREAWHEMNELWNWIKKSNEH